MCGGATGMIAGGLGCLLLTVVGWIGYDSYRIYEMKPCVQEAEDKVHMLKGLPAKYEKKSGKLVQEAKQAAMHFDLAKAKELKKEASDEMHEMHEETCGDGEAIPEQFATCLDYLSGNIIYLVLAPKGLPKSSDVKPYIEKAEAIVSHAGCGSAAALAALYSTGDTLRLSAQTLSSGLLFVVSVSFSAMVASFTFAAGRRSAHGLREPLVMP
eukprot:CAMPEP_0172697766 /NCGR_PEP_ID=MMETSP1074-20121228/28981_1 /TAXON_ID=2916 /ORGANISM="Ceratium fusus, Strain PA161109" /LENGTH=211 /DNA_ID=CAMNT_0013518703 /DNA_START=20 /DNA_END=655 /DNA_ORIENTATION=+